MLTKNVHRNCKRCSKSFLTTARDVARGWGLYCSAACVREDIAARRKKETAERKERMGSNVKCAACAKALYRSPRRLKLSKSGLYFCSNTCRASAQHVGGPLEFLPEHYGTLGEEGYSRYRAKAFKHKASCCELCSYDKFPKLLEVHHKDKNRRNSDLNNLQILCRNCHAEQHMLLCPPT